MARSGNGNTANYLSSATTPITAVPLTIAAWVKPTATTNNCLIAEVDSGGTSDDAFYIAINSSGQAGCTSYAAGSAASSTSTATYSAGVWSHVAGVFASSTSRTGYLNGTASTTNTTSNTPSGIDEMTIGLLRRAAGNTAAMDGAIAYVSYWDAALDANEIAALANGCPPQLIRPQNLRASYKINGVNSPELDDLGGYPMTLNGTMALAEQPGQVRHLGRTLLSWAAATPAVSSIARFPRKIIFQRNQYQRAE